MENPEQRSSWAGDLIELFIEVVVGCFWFVGGIFGAIWDFFCIVVEGICSIIAGIFDGL